MTNDEFKDLITLTKYFADTDIHLPAPGEKLLSPLSVLSASTKDSFFIDVDRKGTIAISKKKLQNRHNNSGTVLIRLEIDCRPHMFCDGSLSSRNHIHIFDEYDGFKVYDLEKEYSILFTDLNDFTTIFIQFCQMCNIDTNSTFIQGVI